MPRKKKRPEVAADGQSLSGNGKLAVNQQFAEDYTRKKRTEEARFLGDADQGEEHSTSEPSSSEDELAVGLTRKVDDKIRQTLEAIQQKDPRVYDSKHNFFGNEEDLEEEEDEEDEDDDEPVAGWDAVARQEEASATAAEKGGMTIKDYVRERIVNEGTLIDEDEDGPDERKQEESKSRLLYNKEQKDLKKAIRADGEDSISEHNSGDDCSQVPSEDEFFTKKKKTDQEIQAEEEDFEAFTRAEQERARGRATGEDILLHSYLEKETLDEKERFLRDFVLNNGWIEQNTGTVPLHRDYEIEVDNPDDSVASDTDNEKTAADRDEEFLEKQEDFENKYNFRFEDADTGHIIQSFGRDAPQESLRRKDDARKRARNAKKLRKEEERRARDEELKRLKNVKKAELRDKLAILEKISGGVNFEDIDLDADFDPDAFSKQMESKFDDDFYNADCEGDEVELGDLDHGQGDGEGVGHFEEDDFDSRNRETGLLEANKLLDQYYKLDYEDVVGGEVTRFNYRKVQPVDFGLSADLILSMDDKKLNQVASMKYLAPYRELDSIPRKAKFAGNVLKNERRKTSNEKEERKGRGKSKKKETGLLTLPADTCPSNLDKEEAITKDEKERSDKKDEERKEKKDKKDRKGRKDKKGSKDKKDKTTRKERGEKRERTSPSGDQVTAAHVENPKKKRKKRKSKHKTGTALLPVDRLAAYHV